MFVITKRMTKEIFFAHISSIISFQRMAIMQEFAGVNIKQVLLSPPGKC